MTVDLFDPSTLRPSTLSTEITYDKETTEVCHVADERHITEVAAGLQSGRDHVTIEIT
jgi:hypothetical protein